MPDLNKQIKNTFLVLFGVVFLLVAKEAHAVNQSLLNAQEAGAALIQGNFEKAIELYDKSLSGNDLPTVRKASIYNDKGVAFWRLKDLKKAIDNFNKAVTIYPELASAYNNRGNVLIQLNYPEEALKDFDQAITISPNFAVAHSNKANAYMRMGRYQEAIKAFSQAIKYMPTNAVPFSGRGLAKRELGQNYASLRDLDHAISLNATYSEAYVNRAEAYAKIDKNVAASKDLSRAIKSHPKKVELYLLRAKAYSKNKLYRQAIKDFKKVIKIKPDFSLAYAELGRIEGQRKRYDAAFANLSKAESLDVNLAEIYIYRAEINLRLNKLDEALKNVNKAIEVSSKSNSEAYYNRGLIQEQLGDPDKAKADYQKSVELDQTNINAWRAFSRISGKSLYSEEKDLGASLNGWVLKLRNDKAYIVSNKAYPKVKLKLEMHGKGEPRLLELSKLEDIYKGIHLLRYYAGSIDEEAIEYIAIIDTTKQRIRGIEPFKVSAGEASWKWDKGNLTVTDPTGLQNKIALRRPRPKPEYYEQDGWWDDEGTFWQSSRRARKKYRKRRRRSFFESLFD